MTRVVVPPEILAGQRSLFARMDACAPAGAPRVGWKIGHAIAEIDALGAEVPVVGCISAATVLADGAGYSAGDGRELRAETEIVVELARAVEADADDDVVRDAIAGRRVALEIVDVARPPYDARGIVEGNVFHRAAVFGTHLAGLVGPVGPATLVVNGTVHDQDDEPPSPLSAVRDVAAMLAACGAKLAAGDRILTGSLVHVPVSPGDELRAHIEGLGHAGAHVVA